MVKKEKLVITAAALSALEVCSSSVAVLIAVLVIVDFKMCAFYIY